MKIFVTGARGFVGRRAAPRLVAAGHEIVGSEREHDVTCFATLREVLSRHRPEAVLHLAALSSVAASWQDPAATFRVNFLGTRCLLQAVRRTVPRARVLLVGSADQYGSAEPGAPPFREVDPQAPRSPYARSKAAAEWLGTLAADDGLDVVCVRAFNHTGAGQSDAFVASSFARQIAEIAAGHREPVLRAGNLDSVRDFLDVDDVIDAYLALLNPDVPAAIYNVCSEQGVPIRRLLEQLLVISGATARVDVDPERLRPTDVLVGDASRLRRATGWRPTRSLRGALEGLLGHWQRQLDVSGRSFPSADSPRSS